MTKIYPTDVPTEAPSTPSLPEPEPSPSYRTEPRVFPSELGHPPGFVPSIELLANRDNAVVGEVPRLPPGGLMPLGGGGLRAPAALMGGGMFPPVFPGENEKRPIELEYTIKVDKIFKMNEEVKGLEPKTTMKMYTAPWDGMCGVSWLESGETYLLSGKDFQKCCYLSEYLTIFFIRCVFGVSVWGIL